MTAVNPTGAEAELCNHVSLEGPATPATVFDCHMAEPPPEEVGGLAVSIWQEQPDPSAEVRVGDPIKFGIEVSNTGDFGAQCLHLRVETDIDGQPSPVDAPPAACEPGGGCDGVADGLCLGPLAVGESVQAKLQAKAPPPAGDYTLLDIAQEDGALYVDETSLHVKGDPAEVAVSVGAPEPYADGWYRAPVYVSTSAALDWIDVQVAYAGDGVEITRAFAYVPPTLGQNVCNPDVPVAANGGVGCHLLDLTGTGEVTVYFETTEPPRFTATIHSPAEGDDPANNVAQWP